MTADTAARIQAVLDAARAWHMARAVLDCLIDSDDDDAFDEAADDRDDAVVHLGDAIDALPSPDECADLLRLAAIGRAVREGGWALVPGDGWNAPPGTWDAMKVPHVGWLIRPAAIAEDVK